MMKKYKTPAGTMIPIDSTEKVTRKSRAIKRLTTVGNDPKLF